MAANLANSKYPVNTQMNAMCRLLLGKCKQYAEIKNYKFDTESDFMSLYNDVLHSFFEDLDQINRLKSLIMIHQGVYTSQFSSNDELIGRIERSLVKRRTLGTSGEFIMLGYGDSQKLIIDTPSTENQNELDFIVEFVRNVIDCLGIGMDKVEIRKTNINMNFSVPSENEQTEISKLFGILKGITPDFFLTKIGEKNCTYKDCLRLVRCYNTLSNKCMKRKLGKNKFANVISGGRLKEILVSKLGLNQSWYKRIITGLINILCDPTISVNKTEARSYSTEEFKSPVACIYTMGYVVAKVDVHKIETVFSSHFVIEKEIVTRSKKT
jgi:hypothetical protein